MRKCNDGCRFLEAKPGEQGLLLCTAGVNFQAVGQAQELCQLCPLLDGDGIPTCEFLEVYTFLHVEKGQQRVEVRLDCWLPEGGAVESRCATCPAVDGPLARGTGTPEVPRAQSVAGHPLEEGL